MTLDQIIAWGGVIVIVEVALIATALLIRTVHYLVTGGTDSVPLLQWRDFLTFVTFVVLIAGQQYARTSGVRLSDQLWWVLLTDGLEISVGTLWLAIEVGLVGRRRSQ